MYQQIIWQAIVDYTVLNYTSQQTPLMMRKEII